MNLQYIYPEFLPTRYRVENPGKCWLKSDALPIVIKEMDKRVYQSPLILTELFQHNLINVSYLTACYLYQVMMTLHFLNDVANDA